MRSQIQDPDNRTNVMKGYVPGNVSPFVRLQVWHFLTVSYGSLQHGKVWVC